jgi:hypothetical protein
MHPGIVNSVLDTGPPAEPGVYLNAIKEFPKEPGESTSGIGMEGDRSWNLVKGSYRENEAPQVVCRK